MALDSFFRQVSHLSQCIRKAVVAARAPAAFRMQGLRVLGSAVAITACVVSVVADAATVRPRNAPDDLTSPDAAAVQAESYFRWRRGELQRIADIGYRIAIAARRACPDDVASLGIVVEHRDQYAPGDRAAAGFAADDNLPRVVAVASQSPAAMAGLRSGDVLALWSPGDARPSAAPTFAGVERAIDVIEARMHAAFANGRPEQALLNLTVVRGATQKDLAIPLVRGCDAWFDLRQSGAADASSDTRWIQFTDAVLALVGDDNDGLAFIAGHEMGHRVMRHGANGSRVICAERCEQQADRLGIAFSAQAGFAAARAPAVLTALASARPGFLGGRRHALLARAARLQELIARGGPAPSTAGEVMESTRRDDHSGMLPTLPNLAGDGKNR